MGLLGIEKAEFEEGGKWLIQAIVSFTRYQEPDSIARATAGFIMIYQKASNTKI